MIALVIVTFIDLFVPLFCGILLLRVIMSYIARPGNRFMEMLVNVTEPLLAPIRRAFPPMAGMDFSPLAAILLLQLIQVVAGGLLR